VAYYNTTPPQGYAGNLYGTRRIDQSIFGGDDDWGAHDYFDTANDGRVGWARFTDALGGDQNFKNYMSNKYPEMWNQFGAASGDDTSMTWTKWLEGNQDQMLSDYANMSPGQKGQQPGRTLGKLRWL
jgi:hypothetical protein